MFSQINKPYFGTVTSSSSMFGFSNAPTTSNPKPFGPFGPSGFGSTSQQQPFGAFSQKSGFTNLFDQPKNTSLPFGLQETKMSSVSFSSQGSGSVFGQQSSSPFDIFGTKPAPSGTVVKFDPVTATDNIQKNGIVSTVNTKLYCITCMSDYKNKSLEELRWEDYGCNRKGPQEPVATAPVLFGQTQNKPTFGFGAGGFGPSNQLFSQATPIFGLSPAATTSIAKPFNTQPLQNAFGTTPTTSNAPSNPFGNIGSTMFGQDDKQSSPASTGLFSRFAQTTSSPQPSMFTFTQQTAKQSSFEPPKFKINCNSFSSKPSPLSTPFARPVSQQASFATPSQPFQFGFGTSTTPVLNKPLQIAPSPLNLSTSALLTQPQPQASLNIGEEFDQQLKEFQDKVEKIFQPFPRREFLKTPKQVSNAVPTNFKMHKEQEQKVIAPVPLVNVHNLRTVPRPIVRGGRFALVDDLSRTDDMPLQYSISQANRKRLNLTKNKLKDETEKSEKTSNTSGQLNLPNQPVKPCANLLLLPNDRGQSAPTGLDITDPNLQVDTLFYKVIKSDKNTQTTESALAKRKSRRKEPGQNIISLQVQELAPEKVDAPEEKGDAGGPTPFTQDETVKTCGIKLNHPEYYTMPPLDQLCKHTDSHGRCIVDNFTIGRVGCGRICFPEPLDVSNLDIDGIVFFQHREVVVYPDENEKPPVGSGLNRRAHITLEQIWPLNKNGDERLKDPEDLEKVNFRARLSLLAERQNATFLDYQPESGSWTFSVEHFSKFYFDDEEDQQVVELINNAEISQEITDRAENEMHQDSNFQHGVIMKSLFFSDAKSSSKGGNQLPTTKSTKKTCTYYASKRFVLLNSDRKTPILIMSSSRNYSDIAIFKSKCFKVGWGLGFKFTAPKSRQHLVMLEIETSDAQGIVLNLEEHMKITLKATTISTNNLEAPLCTVTGGYTSLIDHQHIAEGTDKKMWHLCLAFWGPTAKTPTARRNLFSKWLEDIVSPYVDADLKPQPLANLFTYLTGHQINSAASLAMEQNLPNLAALISQMGTQEFARDLIYAQIKQWEESESLGFVKEDILKLYLLSAGIPFTGYLNTCANLDWKQALGIYLWYVCPNGTSLINAVRAYHEDLDYMPQPYSEHRNCYNMEVHDILFHIMLLQASQSSSLGKILNPATHTSNPLDFRLAWLLLHTFTSLRLGTISPHLADYIHVSFSSQLESMGLWKWGIFVLLFMKDASSKKNAVLSVLDRNLNPDRTNQDNLSTEDFLVNDLRIPHKWIHTILAQKAGVSERHVEAFGHLVCVNAWTEAHSVALSNLVPELLSNGCFCQMSGLFTNLIMGERSIPTWHTGVGLILDIVNLRQNITNMDVMRLKSALSSLCQRVKCLPKKSLKQSWAAAELSRLIAISLRIFYTSSIVPPTFDNLQTALMEIQMLAMPADYKLQELRCISQYLNECY